MTDDLNAQTEGDCCAPDAGQDKPGRQKYDLAVIGAGSAGFSAAITAANEGARVALIGDGTIGGTCVNIGCVPSKNLIRAAEAVYAGNAASRFPGLEGTVRLESWDALVASKNALVTGLRQKKYADLLPEYEGIDYIEAGPARLTEDGVVAGDRPITAGKTIIATGARPRIPGIPGLEAVPFLTSTTALDLAKQPQSLLVLGAGYIGCELAQMFARMGTKVTIVTRTHLLPKAEPEISAALARGFAEDGIKVVEGASYQTISGDTDQVILHIARDGQPMRLDAEKVLVTTGRQANTENLGLREAGIETDDEGAIIVDKFMRTSRANVYAAGDVTGQDQFVYMAAYGAKLAARHATGQQSGPYDNSAMPWVVFTDPQIAGVGLSEQAAQAAGHQVKTSVLALSEVPRALAARDTRGLIKLVADAQTDRLLGGQIMAPEGADSVQTLVMALKMGMTAKQLGETVFPYLTTVEGLKLAAQTFDMDVEKLSCCAG